MIPDGFSSSNTGTNISVVSAWCFECLWNSAVDEQVQLEACTKPGKPCSLHPKLYPPSKGNKASMCKARELLP